MASKNKPTKGTTGKAQYEKPWDGRDLQTAVTEIPEPAEKYPETTPTDLLRASIAKERPGVWLQLHTYEPMPKRAALSVAASWRKPSPALPGDGGQKFEARIIPIGTAMVGASAPLVTPETLYAVAVRYPAPVPEPPTTAPNTGQLSYLTEAPIPTRITDAEVEDLFKDDPAEGVVSSATDS